MPIYKENGYIESIDYQIVRKRSNPPWQSSIRPISEKAAEYILGKADGLKPESASNLQIELEANLKNAMKRYYRGGEKFALKEIISKSKQLAELLGVLTVDNDGE